MNFCFRVLAFFCVAQQAFWCEAAQAAGRQGGLSRPALVRRDSKGIPVVATPATRPVSQLAPPAVPNKKMRLEKEDEEVLTEPEEEDDDAVEGEHPFVGDPRLLTPGMGQLSERYLLLITNVRPNTEEEVRKGYTIVFKETSFLEEWPGTLAAYCAEVTGRMNEMMSARVVHQ